MTYIIEKIRSDTSFIIWFPYLIGLPTVLDWFLKINLSST